MVKQNMLRYAIPFHISYQSMNRNDLFLSLKEAGWNQEHIIHGENDLYDYITDLVNDSVVNDIASSWKLDKELYSKEKYITIIDGREANWKIDKIGLVIFSTGVGILWYEINISKLTEFTQIMDMVYELKELARGDRENNFLIFSIPASDKNDIKMSELQSDSKIKILDTITTPQGQIVKGLKKIELFNDVLKGFLCNIQIDSYFANRVRNNMLCPDRAISFSWAYELNDEEITDALDNAFHLGRAYKSSYDMNSKICVSDFYIPFDDSVWYTSLEGCANYTSPNREKIFYTAGYETRLNTYFYLYILCLGQYYSLLQLAQEVSMLPTDESKYSSKDDRLEVLLDKIHVFNLKSNYSQVGHLTQHNEFYEYIQRRLGINKMQQELEIELQSLFEMIERKKSIKKAKNYQVITIIGGIFVGLQAFINVAAMYESMVNSEWGYFIFASLGCVILSLIGVIVWLLGKIGHKTKKKR